jgi:hypothetical protein
MSTLVIRKKSLKTWLHTDSLLGDFIISKFYFSTGNITFQIVEQGQSKRVIYNIADITLYDDTSGGVAETFGTITELSLRLEELNYPAFFSDGQTPIPALEDLTDVDIDTPLEGQVLTYDETTGKWINEEVSGGIESVVAGDNITVDNTDPSNPIVNAVIPPFVPSDYDLEDFTNTGVDPYAHVSDIPDTPTLQEVYNASTPPEIVGNGVNGAVVLKSGSNDGHKLLVVKSTTGAETAFLLGNGNFEGGYIYGTWFNVDAGNGLQDTSGVTKLRIYAGVDSVARITANRRLDYDADYSAYFNNRSLVDVGYLSNYLKTEEKTADFTAVNGAYYVVNTGGSEVIDPVGVTNKGYIVHVIGGTLMIGEVPYTAGALVYRYYNGSSWVSTNMAGGGAVDSVNGQTGVVVLDTGDITEVTDKNYVTDAELTVIGNTSGTNTGDNATNTTSNTYADGKVTDAIVNGVTTVAPSQNAVFDALATKEPTITAGTSAQYYRGDKTFQTLDKTAVGLSNVDNTSDANKPVSTAQQTALDFKVNKARTIFQPKTSITGVTGEQVIFSMLIPAGTYASTDAFNFEFSINKSVTATTVEYKTYVGTTVNALTNQIGRTISNATTRSSDYIRKYIIDSGNLDCSIGFTTNGLTGYIGTTSVNTPIAVTVANDIYITVTANPTVTTEVVGVFFASITPLK